MKGGNISSWRPWNYLSICAASNTCILKPFKLQIFPHPSALLNTFLYRARLQSAFKIIPEQVIRQVLQAQKPYGYTQEHCDISAPTTLVFLSSSHIIPPCCKTSTTYLKIGVVVVRMLRLAHLDGHSRLLHELASCQCHCSQHALIASKQYFLQNLRSNTSHKHNLLSKQHGCTRMLMMDTFLVKEKLKEPARKTNSPVLSHSS